MRRIESDVVERILRAYTARPVIDAVARELNIGHSTVRRYVLSNPERLALLKAERDGTAPVVADIPVAPLPPPDPVEEACQRLETARKLATERDLVFALAGEKSLRSKLESLLLDTVPAFTPPPAYVPRTRTDTKLSEETALLLWSDWHGFEIVKKSRVQGFNEYNAAIQARRAHRIVHKSLDIKDRLERGGYAIPHAVVACNGDFVSGTIHDVERHADAPNVMMAVYGEGILLAQALRDLAAEFETVQVKCTSGNHGRLPDARKMQQKDPTRNWDTMIYLVAQASLRNVPNISFTIPDAYAVSYDIYGHTFLQYHGHDIKGWNSIPHYGIQRYTRNNNALRARTAKVIDYFLISHFHTDSAMPAGGGSNVFVNGSLIGGTELSMNVFGEMDVPKQKLLFVNQTVGVTSQWTVLGEVPHEKYTGTYTAKPWEHLD